MDEMIKMAHYFNKNQNKTQKIHQLLDDHDPIDHQILALMDAQQLNIDIIPLDNPKHKQKKPKQ